ARPVGAAFHLRAGEDRDGARRQPEGPGAGPEAVEMVHSGRPGIPAPGDPADPHCTMNDLLFRQVMVLDPGGPLHNTVTDLRFTNGRLAKAGPDLPRGKGEEIALPGLHAS